MDANELINSVIALSGIMIGMIAVYIAHKAGRKRLNLRYFLNSFDDSIGGLHLLIKMENQTQAFVQIAEIGMKMKKGSFDLFNNFKHPLLLASGSVFFYSDP